MPAATVDAIGKIIAAGSATLAGGPPPGDLSRQPGGADLAHRAHARAGAEGAMKAEPAKELMPPEFRFASIESTFQTAKRPWRTSNLRCSPTALAMTV